MVDNSNSGGYEPLDSIYTHTFELCTVDIKQEMSILTTLKATIIFRTS